MNELRLLETIHPTKEGMNDFEALFGIDAIKESLIDELALILDRKRLEDWGRRHHSDGLGILKAGKSTLPLILHSNASYKSVPTRQLVGDINRWPIWDVECFVSLRSLTVWF
jgi:hypothetical protein